MACFSTSSVRGARTVLLFSWFHAAAVEGYTAAHVGGIAGFFGGDRSGGSYSHCFRGATRVAVVCAAQDDPLPLGWREATAPDGRAYYYVADGDGTTQWKRPTEPDPGAVAAAAAFRVPSPAAAKAAAKEDAASDARILEALFGGTPEAQAAIDMDPEVASHMKLRTDEDGNPVLLRFVFVDEMTCIGCTYCAEVARSTFYMNEEAGRARVFNQHGDEPAVVQEAIDSCPVNCISFIDHEDLVILETEREGITINPMTIGIPATWSARMHSVPPTKAKLGGASRMCCNNCPGRGCKECPMFGVGLNPVYQERMAAKEAKKEVSGEAEQERFDAAAQETLDAFFGAEPEVPLLDKALKVAAEPVEVAAEAKEEASEETEEVAEASAMFSWYDAGLRLEVKAVIDGKEAEASAEECVLSPAGASCLETDANYSDGEPANVAIAEEECVVSPAGATCLETDELEKEEVEVGKESERVGQAAVSEDVLSSAELSDDFFDALYGPPSGFDDLLDDDDMPPPLGLE